MEKKCLRIAQKLINFKNNDGKEWKEKRGESM